MSDDSMTVLPGPQEPSVSAGSECQTALTAHTEPKRQIGEVSNPTHYARVHYSDNEASAVRAALRSLADAMQSWPPGALCSLTYSRSDGINIVAVTSP